MPFSPNYFVLRPSLYVLPLNHPRHKPYLPHYERIHTHSQWVELGLSLRLDENGYAISKKRGLYRWANISRLSDAERDAFETGRRFVDHFFPLLEYVKAGVDFDEFICHPIHYRFFCTGCLAQEGGRPQEAIKLFANALQLQPDEVRYAERFYATRIAQGDTSAIAEELEYFKNEIDSMIHSGRVDIWLKLLLEKHLMVEAAQVVQQVDTLLESTCLGKLPPGRYSGQDIAFVTAKRDEFRAKISKWEGSRRFAPLMTEIARLGGLPSMSLKLP